METSAWERGRSVGGVISCKNRSLHCKEVPEVDSCYSLDLKQVLKDWTSMVGATERGHNL